MKFNDEHKAIYDTVKDFAINEIKPFADEWDPYLSNAGVAISV